MRLDPFHADPPDASSVFLCSHGNQEFPAVCPPPGRPDMFHLPLPFHSAGRGPAAPSLVLQKLYGIGLSGRVRVSPAYGVGDG